MKHKSSFEQILIMKSMDCFIVPSLLLWDYMHKKEKNHFGTFSIPLEVIGIQMKDSFGVYYKSYRRANSRHSAINLFFKFPSGNELFDSSPFQQFYSLIFKFLSKQSSTSDIFRQGIFYSL